MRKKYFILNLLIFIFINFSIRAQQIESENLFYMVDKQDCYESFKNNIENISIIAPQVYALSEAGVVWGEVDSRVLRLAEEHNVKVMPLIVNPGFNLNLFHNFLHSEKAKARAIQMMTDLAKKYNFYGWQFDFENIHADDRDLLTEFYKNTAQALHQNGFKLSIAVVPRNSNVGGTTVFHHFLYEYWKSAYDLKALADAGDFISLMTYAEHTRRTPPGPGAGLPWVESMIKFALNQGISPGKISFGIPSSTLYWHADYSDEKGGYSTGTAINYAAAEGLIERYNAKKVWLEDQGCYYAMMDNDGIFEYVFLADARSFEKKIELLKKYKFRGISVWRIGREDPATWDILARETKPVLK